MTALGTKRPVDVAMHQTATEPGPTIRDFCNGIAREAESGRGHRYCVEAPVDDGLMTWGDSVPLLPLRKRALMLGFPVGSAS
jgi:hypothetical protein